MHSDKIAEIGLSIDSTWGPARHGRSETRKSGQAGDSCGACVKRKELKEVPTLDVSATRAAGLGRHTDAGESNGVTGDEIKDVLLPCVSIH